MSSISPINKNIQVLHPGNTTYFDKIHSEYSVNIFTKKNIFLTEKETFYLCTT